MHQKMLYIHTGDLISSPTTHYEVQQFLGSGTYGLVIQCRDLIANDMVAVKITKNKSAIPFAKGEQATLRAMEQLNSDSFHIIRLKDSFHFREHFCLVFEYLAVDLLKFMHTTPNQHLQLKELRPIVQQLAISLDFLKSAGIIHSDLKPENIMLVDPVRQPFKVKVIDFGLACNSSEKFVGQILQTLFYRSPEIVLKAPFNEAIDIWSLGCIVAELFMGMPLFPAKDEADLMMQILSTKPLHEQKCISYWFWPKYWMERRFMEAHPFGGKDEQAEYCDLQYFIDLLRQMLKINQFDRITPRQILQHPFVTMSHIRGPFRNCFYLKSSEKLMDSCWDQSSDNEDSEESRGSC